jgi:hypothetical protein
MTPLAFWLGHARSLAVRAVPGVPDGPNRPQGLTPYKNSSFNSLPLICFPFSASRILVSARSPKAVLA